MCYNNICKGDTQKGGDTMTQYIPYIISTLTFILTLIKFIFDERRVRRKERQELMDKLKEAENGISSFPPRTRKSNKR